MAKKTTKKVAKKKPNQTKGNRTGTKESQKRNKPVTISSDLTKVRKNQEYLGFLQFMATPSALWPDIYEVKDQAEYAKKIGVEPATLSDWKNIPGYYDDVVAINKQFFKARISNVMLALETKNLNPKTVNGADVRVLATYAEAYNDRVEQDLVLPKEVQEALAKVASVLD